MVDTRVLEQTEKRQLEDAFRVADAVVGEVLKGRECERMNCENCQIRWERDVAHKQLSELGVGFARESKDITEEIIKNPYGFFELTKLFNKGAVKIIQTGAFKS